ncbi:Fibroleukin [Holothuria leucospilota]|uniref:Fibroleukin n=1 Tax=Holothuria leucospilota TaxID=206669 RepID=A0A9Q1BZJ2_HOLLE|nr:Fibroleukin [Holothuria leucospilota]
MFLQANKSQFSSDCSEHCTCDEESLTCDRNVRCDTNAICEERNSVRKCYCIEGYIGDGLSCTRTGPPSDCYDVFTSGRSDGVYTILPIGWTGSPFEVYCNMSHGGGWTVLQRRVDGSVSFRRSWDDYKEGFGTVGSNQNLWLGNEILYYMTNQRINTLRIDIVNENLFNWFMNYDLFRVDNESNNYRLELGSFTGNTGYDYMVRHRGGQDFSTYDRDNDEHPDVNCALNAGWWYARPFGSCWSANLNGIYNFNLSLNLHNVDTLTTHSGLRYIQMKIRPM